MKIILMGNPNVGKSVIFSRLTGTEVISANYPGTSVGYTEGRVMIGGTAASLVDVPGMYSLDPSSPIEEIARQIFDQGADVVVNVVDATNLERNLHLTLQILEVGIPTVVALNLWDVAVKRGITIDASALAGELGVPVVPTVAVSGQGIRDLVRTVEETASQPSNEIYGPVYPTDFAESTEQRWVRVGEIVSRVQRVEHRHPSLLERLEDITIRPWTGIPVAILVLYVCFSLIIDLGELIMARVTDPLFDAYSRWVYALVASHATGLLRDLLVGSSPELLQSFGILTTGLYIPLGVVLPFLIPFYLVLGFLEDLGYLPRISVLLDAMMHRIGLHGAAILPCVLGMGCSVPAVLAVRVLESPKQRYLAATLMTMTIPCASQTAMIFGMLGQYGLKYIAMVYATLIMVFIVTGLLLHRLIKEESPEIFLEIPPYRMPDPHALLRKTHVRLKSFLAEAVPYIGVGMLIMNIFQISGFLHLAGESLRPVVSVMLGLPSDAAGALIIGFLRKDVGIGMFAPMDMSPEQLVIASVVLAMYFPCVATFMVLIKELGISGTAKSVGLRLAASLVVGSVLSYVLIP
ncbi:MAG: hypothetical protein A4E47_00153 [Methanosaeta sp. PtaU1.Bin028]|nr:MAG: hypothetical protein A4E47_00153 [Methanosaeta sp. PtaU1.Bin028]